MDLLQLLGGCKITSFMSLIQLQLDVRFSEIEKNKTTVKEQ